MTEDDIRAEVDFLISEIDPTPVAKIDELREGLAAFFRDNRGKPPEELARLAGYLYDGRSFHDCGHIVWRVLDRHLWSFKVCPLFAAAALYATWHGGKVGFAHMPDVREVDDVGLYAECADRVLQPFWDSGDRMAEALGETGPHSGHWNPRWVLTNYEWDRDFYDSLPDRFTIYRGGVGISHEMLATGLCWTTQRAIAEWFAHRTFGSDREHVLVSARIPKSAIYLAFNSECEVVAQPFRWRALKCRPRKGKPPMHWREGENPELAAAYESGAL